MKSRTERLLVAALLAATVLMPLCAGGGLNTRTLISSAYELSCSNSDLAAIEVLDSFVDPWGGVYNSIASVQNATQYGYAHVETLESIVRNQMQTDDGCVTESAFVLMGMVPFPNGAIGGPMAVLQLQVEPLLVCPANREGVAFTDLSQSEAVAAAEEFVSVYEAAFTISLERLMMSETNEAFYFSYGIPSGILCRGRGYWLTYIGMFTNEQGASTMTKLRERLASLGGFMDVAGAPSWPDLKTIAAEGYLASHVLPDYDSAGSVLSMISSHSRPLIRSDHPDLVGSLQSVIMAECGFDESGYVTAGSGDELYSLKEHVSYSSNIRNKMQEDGSVRAVSVVGGQAPGQLIMDAIPATWLSIDDQFEIPGPIILPGGMVIPDNASLSELIAACFSDLPRQVALGANSQLGMIPVDAIDDVVEYIWGGTGLYPDMREALLGFNYSLVETPVVELNIDLMSRILERAGFTPNALTEQIDPSLAMDNPVGALVEACVRCFDSYHLLDLLQPEYYQDPVVVESLLDTIGDDFERFMGDSSGLDLPEELSDKEAIAAFVQEHWDIILQALWVAMADDDLPGIENAIHAMLNSTNLQKHITPYLIADLGYPLTAGMGFGFAVNIDKDTGSMLPLDVTDIALEFDSDMDRLELSGPYLVVVKDTPNRTVSLGQVVQFSITVHNCGTTTAYDVKVLDGMSRGLDGIRDFYWTRTTLAPNDTWTIAYAVVANDTGLYMDMPAVCVYFNQTLSGFIPENASLWTGSARYAISALGNQIRIEGPGDLYGPTIFGIPVLYFAAGVGGFGVIGVVVLLSRRRQVPAL